MSTLGIGVRVYVGWTTKTSTLWLCCRTGMIVGGPYQDYVSPDGTTRMSGRTWRVAIDDTPHEPVVKERIITPIDPDALTVDEQEEVEA